MKTRWSKEQARIERTVDRKKQNFLLIHVIWSWKSKKTQVCETKRTSGTGTSTLLLLSQSRENYKFSLWIRSLILFWRRKFFRRYQEERSADTPLVSRRDTTCGCSVTFKSFWSNTRMSVLTSGRAYNTPNPKSCPAVTNVGAPKDRVVLKSSRACYPSKIVIIIALKRCKGEKVRQWWYNLSRPTENNTSLNKFRKNKPRWG